MSESDTRPATEPPHVHSVACAYLNQMEDLKVRLAIADSVIDQARTQGPAVSHYELMALQLRKILELIAFASLAAHKDQYTALYANYATHWNAKRLLKNLRSINADFYPKPIELSKSPILGEVMRFDYVRSGYLTEDDFVELYERASAALHTPNPFATPVEHTFGRSFGDWLDRIVFLMRLHQIKLPTVREHWIVMLASAENGRSSLLTSIEVDESTKR